MNPSSSTDSKISLRARFRTATREAILDAAATLLGADGASQTRMEDIALRAGVAVGTVYNYFEDRTALVSALLDTRTQALMDVLDDTLAGPPLRRAGGPAQAQTPAEAFEAELERFVSACWSHFDANRFLLNVLMDEERQRGIDAKAASRRRTVLGALLDRAGRLMERGIRTRALRKDDPEAYAAILIGMVRGLTLSALTGRRDLSADGTGAIVRLFMKGAAR